MRRPVADKRGYRGIQLASTEQAQMTGDGPITLRRERSLQNAGSEGTREMAVTACKAAIDKLLGPQT